MFDDIDNQIKSAKDILKKKSEDYIQNFNNIKNYIDIEIQEIKRSKNLNQPIIPEINFDSIEGNNEELIKKIKQKGCVIVRNVFNARVINTLNKERRDRMKLWLLKVVLVVNFIFLCIGCGPSEKRTPYKSDSDEPVSNEITWHK